MIQGVCATCGFIFLLEHGLDCPACEMAERAEQVTLHFSKNSHSYSRVTPKGLFDVDKLRDALGAGYAVPEDDTPRDLRIPQDEQAQVYELRRMFRL